jgi:uncharacterized glyoxalase superfamily protein PhnB
MTQPVPEGYRTVTPWLISQDSAALIRFIERAFDGREIARVLNPDGRIGHAEMTVGDSVVMLFDSPPGWPSTPAFIRLYVPDADATLHRALQCGATAVTQVTYLAFGDRVGRVRDPQGHVWWLQTHVEDVDADTMRQRWSEPAYADAMAYVQNTLQHSPPS